MVGVRETDLGVREAGLVACTEADLREDRDVAAAVLRTGVTKCTNEIVVYISHGIQNRQQESIYNVSVSIRSINRWYLTTREINRFSLPGSCDVAVALVSETDSTLETLQNRPWFGSHVKYRTSCTDPSFFPAGCHSMSRKTIYSEI